MSIFTIAIIGRANVGKTTIFNRIVGKNNKQATAIVKDYSGTTRDRNEVITDYFGFKVKIIDCAGIEYQNQTGTIAKQMLDQALKSIDFADLCIFVIDGKEGVLNADIDVFNVIRKKNKKVILAVNKAENPQNINIDELYKINCRDKFYLSAEHNLGFGEMYNLIKQEYDIWKEKNEDNVGNYDIQKVQEDLNHKIRIAVIGRPNAGKSTFLNNLLQENRLITSDIAGTTRDKIELDFTYKNRGFVLIDTAGIRKKYKTGEDLEYISVEKSLEALQFADVGIVIMDTAIDLEEQDLSLCQRVCNEGRILVICFNKWDLIPENKREDLLKKTQEKISKNVSQVKGIVFFTCSAIKDRNLEIMLDEIVKLYDKWNSKISAGKMNKKIEEAKMRPNVITELKIRYITQIKSRPPTFVAFSGRKEKDISKDKIEGLKNWICREFDLFGVCIRLSVRNK